jgi:flagellar biosynthesis protein FliR
MYEPKHKKLLPPHLFYRRMARHVVLAAAVLIIGLGSGVIGYHTLAGLGWIDSLLNASMILGGMGPVDPLKSDAAKVFASIYALFSGLLLLSTFALVITPVFHRMFHKFHIDEKD